MDWPYLAVEVPFGFAHQGGTEVAPGNTDAAFDHAAALGYRYIETDVQVTADGVLVIFHDDDTEALTGVPGRIEDRTWDEVSQLRIDGRHPIPRFDEVVVRLPEVRFNVEPKTDGAVAALVEAIAGLDLIDRVGVGSFRDRRVRRLRSAVGTRLATSPGPLGLVRVLLLALIWPRATVPYAAVQIPPRAWIIPLTGAGLIDRFHRLGLQVHVWTIDDEDEMIGLLDRGVDAIMTDRPTVLRDVLRSRDRWPQDGDS